MLAILLLGVSTPTAGAVFTQCPPVGLNTGCQFLITVTDAGPAVAQDTTQGPYEGVADSLLGIQNNSSHAIVSISVTSSGGPFDFDGDGICNNGHGPAPAGCQPPPGSAASCNPSNATTNHCSFPPPPGEPPNYTEPGATNQGEEFPKTPVQQPWPNGDLQNGYEGPGIWFSGVSMDFNTGVVNFSPPLAPGASTYWGLEQPTSTVTGVINVATAADSTVTTLAGDGLTGATLTVPQGAPVTDTAHISGAKAAKASGTVNYAVYRDSACTMLAAARSSAMVTNGAAGASAALNLGSGTYYPVATYNGDAANSPSSSKCGAEVLTVARPWNANLPRASRCLGRRLRFLLRKPKSVRSGSVHVDINGHLFRKLMVSGHRRPLVVLRKLPTGSFHVEVILTSRNGRTFEESRLFRRC